MIVIQKCLVTVFSSIVRSGDHYSRTSPFLSTHSRTCHLSLYRSRSFVLVKRIINTYNGFLILLPRTLYRHFTAPRWVPCGTHGNFFLQLHFSLSPLCSRSALNTSLPKYSYELLISIPFVHTFFVKRNDACLILAN